MWVGPTLSSSGVSRLGERAGIVKGSSMEWKDAVLALLVICLFLAILLLSGKVAPTTAGCAFAAALAILGVLSRGFRKTSHN